LGTLPLIILPHPVGQLPRHALDALADQSIDQILAAITRPRAELAHHFRGRASGRAAGEGG
jgi:hypothetical protein